MKVKIGPYVNWFGPYQLAELLCFWAKKEKDELGFPRKADWVHEFGAFLAHGRDKDQKKETYLYKFLNWIHSKKERKIKIELHPHDVWSLDSTLSIIILPALLLLKEQNHGTPFVKDEDVPEELRSTNAPPKKNEWDWDENNSKRWDWVMNEMIWAFCQKQPDYDWEEQYSTGDIGDIVFEDSDVPADSTGKLKLKTMKFTGDYKVDWEARKKHQERMSNGFILFGKYFEALWD